MRPPSPPTPNQLIGPHARTPDPAALQRRVLEASSSAASSSAAPSGTTPATPPLAYPEIPEEEGTVTIDRNARSGRPGATTTPGGARPTARTTSAATPSSRSAVRSRPTSTGSTRAGAVSGPLSISAVVGFVLSGLGFFLVTVPFGLWLGYRGLQETENAASRGLRLPSGPYTSAGRGSCSGSWPSLRTSGSCYDDTVLRVKRSIAAGSTKAHVRFRALGDDLSVGAACAAHRSR